MFKAQALHNPDDLLTGMVDGDWRVRHQVVDRLIARARTDDRTLHALLDRLACDSAWQVRDAVAMAINSFKNDGRVVQALRVAIADESDEVRWSAAHSLRQLGEAPEIRPES
jgi:HEAT repeat protein